MKKLVDNLKTGVTEIKDRATSKTPKFWKKVQLFGVIIGGVGTLIVTLPVSLPVGLVAAGGYLVTAGGTIAGVAQLTKE